MNPITDTETTALETAKANGHYMIPFKDATLGWERRVSHQCKICFRCSIVHIVYNPKTRTTDTSAEGSALTKTCKEIVS